MATSTASNSKTLFLASLILEWVLLCSWNLLMCLPSIYWMWVRSGITISVLICNSVLMSWPRAIPMFWTTFSHDVHILSVEFFSTYVNIDLPRAFNIPKFSFSLMELICFPLPEWLPMPLPELLPLQEPSPLPEPPLPIPMAVDCRHWYWPYFLLGQRSLKLRCRWSSLLGLGTLITQWLDGGCPLLSLCLYLSNRIFEIVPVNKCFYRFPGCVHIN